MENTDYLYKTKPNYIFVVFMIIGAGFFIFLSSLAWPFKNGNITADVLLVFFGLFAFLFLCFVIGFKIIYLTSTEIIITIPVIFYKRVIMLSDIKICRTKMYL